MITLSRWTIGITILSLLATGIASAGNPTDDMRETIEKVLTILESSQSQVSRRDQLRQVIYERFNFEQMARRSLGRHWRKLTDEQRLEFVELFSDLLERSYIGRIENTGAGSEIDYSKETVNEEEGLASVLTIITDRVGSKIDVEYRLLQSDTTSWEVYDVVIEGVSLVNNYRTQFNNIIHRSSPEGLLKHLRLKKEQEEAAE